MYAALHLLSQLHSESLLQVLHLFCGTVHVILWQISDIKRVKFDPATGRLKKRLHIFSCQLLASYKLDTAFNTFLHFHILCFNYVN